MYSKEFENYRLHIGEMGHHSVPINYCPFCGRKLK